ncbi:MAG: alpha/beta hydrolase [Anaerolineaceae bacterium]|nr:alpha/beta hydrolase [Anaerolineaceae bacterium]
MPQDLSAIHPELRSLFKSFPRFSIHRKNLKLARWMSRIFGGQKTAPGTHIETVEVPGEDLGQKVRLRVYRPEALPPASPALIWIHGGGYVFGTVEMDDSLVSHFAHELGLLVVSVDYRLAPEHPFPAPLQDCYAALKWAHDHAADLGIDPQRIAVGGDSAGGGLAACLAQLAIDRGEVQPVFQLLVYPMLDDRTVLREDVPHPELLTWSQVNNRFGWESYLHQPGGLEQALPYAAAARRADLTGLPPAWVGVGTLDLFHDESVAYAQRLKDNGVECTLEVIQGAFHGFDVMTQTPQVVKDFRRAEIEALRKGLFGTD